MPTARTMRSPAGPCPRPASSCSTSDAERPPARTGCRGAEGRGDTADRRAARPANCVPTTACSRRRAADNPCGSSVQRVWIVDPLDGTREFGEPGRNDWAVHVALVAGEVRLGVVLMPATGELFDGIRRHDRRPQTGAQPSSAAAAAEATLVMEALGGALVEMGSAGRRRAPCCAARPTSTCTPEDSTSGTWPRRWVRPSAPVCTPPHRRVAVRHGQGTRAHGDRADPRGLRGRGPGRGLRDRRHRGRRGRAGTGRSPRCWSDRCRSRSRRTPVPRRGRPAGEPRARIRGRAHRRRPGRLASARSQRCPTPTPRPPPARSG